ncbi:phosphoethanolamine transferase [Pseudorhodoferax sp. Leaf267]|uniref:phosphoethanolamine transferase n=1 Tax=Pseudorhodoferax sp. Leaf267 TaxID=1736316 RepID=UPI00070195E1|nr:phosphoethanolamine--lipid A transferase [Pseudorhodoferax sp. Leaf267]KQP18010.1 sulfatase [Pseudorhodoferax sp. Leaf267]
MSAVWPPVLTAPRAEPARSSVPAWLRTPGAVLVIASLWMAAATNPALWRELRTVSILQAPGGLFFAGALGLAVTAILVLLGSLLAWRWTFKPALIALLMVSAIGCHFMWRYGIAIDASMLTNVLQTDPHEAADLASWPLLMTLGGLGVLPAWAVWRWPVQYGRWPRRAGRNLLLALAALAVLGGTLLASYQPLASNWRNHKQLRYLINPLNTVYAAGALAVQPLRRPPGPLQAVALDAHLAPPLARPPLVMLVLGETGRAGNFGLNGYARDTTPALAREDVASFRDAWSCGTSTAASVPCMFSHLGKQGFEARSGEHENLLDVLQRAGLAVLWLDNQSGCKGVCARVPHVETAGLADPLLCKGGQCLDGILLKDLDARIAAMPAERRARGVVLVLHQMGSHGPAYAERSPAASKRFTPECIGNDLQHCAREAIVNAYDNSIAYTDEVLAGAIGWLKTQTAQYDPAMVYVADHGESLGENNLYLHGLPYAMAPDVQKHVPWITWLSPGFQARRGVAMDCLRAQAGAHITHDHLFHSMLGLAGVQTQVYRQDLDAYASCAPT